MSINNKGDGSNNGNDGGDQRDKRGNRVSVVVHELTGQAKNNDRDKAQDKAQEKSRPLHIRRCHVCTGVTECEERPVTRCVHCNKPMAPFFYFDELQVTAITDVQLRPIEPREGERFPIRGFTAYW